MRKSSSIIKSKQRLSQLVSRRPQRLAKTSKLIPEHLQQTGLDLTSKTIHRLPRYEEMSSESLLLQEVKPMGEKFRQQIKKNGLQQYFVNLDRYVNKGQWAYYKKYDQLPSGLYILVEGKIEYNFNLILTENQPLITPLIVQQPYTVFESANNRFSVLEDCIVMAISEQLRFKTKFNQLYQQRRNLIQNSHLGIQPYSTDNLFKVDMKLHSSFRKCKYYFHNKLTINTLAIVSAGVVKPVMFCKQLNLSFNQMSKYAILVPSVQYEIVSNQAQLLIVENNPSLVFLNQKLVLGIEILKANQQGKCYENLSAEAGDEIKGRKINSVYSYSLHHSNKRNKSLFQDNKTYVKMASSAFLCIEGLAGRKRLQEGMSKRELGKRTMLLTQVCKNLCNQLIIPMETCKKSIDFTESKKNFFKNKQRIITQQSQKFFADRKQKILFDFNKYTSHHSSSKEAARQNNRYLLKTANAIKTKVERDEIFRISYRKDRAQRSFQNISLLDKYEKVSKELHDKFIQSRKISKRKDKQNIYEFNRKQRSFHV